MKVLILSASTGGGHNRASAALKEYITKADPLSQVRIIDAIQECSKLFNATITRGYHFLATKTPSLFGAMYKGADKESILSDMITNINGMFARRLIPILDEFAPDIIVSCHPFAAKMMASVKEKHGYTIPLVAILTDFMPHMSYVDRQITAYVTPTDAAADTLSANYGIDRSLIHDIGMPIFDRFYTCEEEKRDGIMRELGFDRSKRTVLVMAGSFGVTDILKIYEQLVNIDLDYQIIVITGRNKRLYNAFEKMLGNDEEFETEDAPEFIRGLSDDNPVKLLYNYNEQLKENIKQTFRRSTANKKPTRLFYFVDNVEDYMHVSDLIITKPGGLTTAESISCCLPMAIFKAFPGQEEQNAEYLIESGIAIPLTHGEDVSVEIEDVLSHPEKLDAMKTACERRLRQNSCEHIYDLLQKILDTQT